jgi:hypothetical protein
MLHHRYLGPALAVLLGLASSAQLVAQNQQNPKNTPAPSVVAAKVFLTPTCGCCGKWADHMKAAKFDVTREVTTDLDAVPARQRVPRQLRSCHTAVIGPYVVEGHVPADVIRQLLKDRPKIAGIAVPGMPMGSPGMEGPNPRPYSIVAFRADGTSYEFARR